jgi:hypothetical protein
MRSARELIEETVKLGPASMLKRHGFKKSAFTFTRRQGSVAHFLNLQLSQWNQGADGRFYVNAGVLFDDMVRLRGVEPPLLPKYGDCDFLVRWERLDSNLPASVKVDESTDPTELSDWLTGAIERCFVLPLNSVTSTQEFARTGWTNAIPWGFLAKYNFVIGNLDEAKRLVQLEADTFADRGCTFESVAKSLHLPLKP